MSRGRPWLPYYNNGGGFRSFGGGGFRPPFQSWEDQQQWNAWKQERAEKAAEEQTRRILERSHAIQTLEQKPETPAPQAKQHKKDMKMMKKQLNKLANQVSALAKPLHRLASPPLTPSKRKPSEHDVADGEKNDDKNDDSEEEEQEKLEPVDMKDVDQAQLQKYLSAKILEKFDQQKTKLTTIVSGVLKLCPKNKGIGSKATLLAEFLLKPVKQDA
jgi:hypothetical protein